MERAFSKEELVPASHLRYLSQKRLWEHLQHHEKLGVLFAHHGLGAVVLSYDQYDRLLQQLDALEEQLEAIELAAEFGARVATPIAEGVPHPPDQTLEAVYRERRARRPDA
jgi:glycine/D-amino acid oxidase-like deaminating enzyme